MASDGEVGVTTGAESSTRQSSAVVLVVSVAAFLASLDLDLAAVRTMPMWSSSVALLLFAAALGAMLLGSVMLLTTVWHEHR
jgi:hypothetical protein